MKVYRYTEAVQKEFKLPVKPEPWLHCAVYMSDMYPCIAIWVWDTRQIVHDKGIANYTGDTSAQKAKLAKKWLAEHATVANDNHRPLKGQSARDINDELAGVRLNNKTASFAVVSGEFDNWLNSTAKFTGKVISIDSFDKAYALFSKTVRQWFDEHKPMWTPANFDRLTEPWQKTGVAKRASEQGISMQQAIKAYCNEKNEDRERSITSALDRCMLTGAHDKKRSEDCIAIMSTALKPLKDIAPGSTINTNRRVVERGVQAAKDARKQQSK